MEPIRVLIVDDSSDIRLMLRIVLGTDPRFEVVGEAGNGKQAIEALQERSADVMILDLMMPVMDGLEALPEIRRLDPDLRVIAHSGYAADIGGRAIEACADVFVEKGAPPGALLDLISRTYESPPKSIGVRVVRP